MESLDSNRSNRSRKRSGNMILTFITMLLSLCCVICCVILILLVTKVKPTEDVVETMTDPQMVTYSQEEVDTLISQAAADAKAQTEQALKADLKAAYTDGDGIMNKLRTMYPEDMIFYDSDHYAFIPINKDLPQNNVLAENLTLTETGEMIYNKDGAPVSVKGIDVSKYQGKIDWSKVASQGIEFAILRTGIRGYSTGAIVLDDTFEYNLKAATAAGIDVGVYFFTQAVDENEAIEEANFVLNAISGYTVTYPIIIDVEVLHEPSARTYSLTQDQRTSNCIAFCDTIKNAGYTPMIYGNLKSYGNMLDVSRLTAYDKWFAFYDTTLYFPYELSMWQYTDKAVIDGIEGPVDLNITFEKKWGN